MSTAIKNYKPRRFKMASVGALTRPLLVGAKVGASDLTYFRPYCYYLVDFKSKKATYRSSFQEFKWFSICTYSKAAKFTNDGSSESKLCAKKCVHWTQSGQSPAQKFCYANYLPKEVEASWKRKWFKIQHAGTWIISRCFTMKGDTMQLGLFQILILSLVITRIRAEVEHQRDGKGIQIDAVEQQKALNFELVVSD